MKNNIPLLFIFLLFCIIAITFFLSSPSVELTYPESEQACAGGEKQCYVGNCSGLSLCVNGKWAPCELEVICVPGTRLPCVENGCAKAYKECNECGTFYSQCISY